jgi:hypothetical protein
VPLKRWPSPRKGISARSKSSRTGAITELELEQDSQRCDRRFGKKAALIVKAKNVAANFMMSKND